MARALAETQRRRQLQLEYNQKHGITPETVKKAIKEFMPELARERKEKRAAKVAAKTPADLAKLIKELEREMFAAAKRLEFERAAQLRDEIRELLRELIGIEG
jgi:excinuclease ABC subunit B